MMTPTVMMLDGIAHWLHHPVVERLGWVLVHFVWQGTLVAGVLAAVLAWIRAERARLRYALSLAALAALLALPVVTWFALPGPVASTVAAPAAEEFVAPPAEVAAVVSGTPIDVPLDAPAPTWTETARAALAAGLPWLVIGWGGGVLLLALRLLGGWVYTLRLRRAYARPVSDVWQHRAAALAERIGVARTVRFWQSPRLDVPLVMGWVRPVVLVPVGVLTGLPPDQVEAILAHELIHIRRHDVLVGRLQAVVETLLFYHPAVWWVSRQVRIEREHCCDDRVVQACRDRVGYARALTALAERRTRHRPTSALAATDGALLARIRRLVAPATSPSVKERVTAAAAVGVVVAMLVAIGACASQQPVATDGTEGAAEPAPAAETADRPPSEDAEIVFDTDTTHTVERRIVRTHPDSSERVTVHVRSGTEEGRWHAFTDSLGGFSFVFPERADSLDRQVQALLRRHLAGLDTIPVPPIPDVPAVPPLDSLSAFHPSVPPVPEVPEFWMGLDTIDFGAFRDELDALRTLWPDRAWGLDSLERARIDSLRREMRAHREEIRRLTRERREEIARLQRERHAQMQADQSDRLRSQAERLRRQAERLEEQARELEQPAPDPPEPEDEDDGANR